MTRLVPAKRQALVCKPRGTSQLALKEGNKSTVRVSRMMTDKTIFSPRSEHRFHSEVYIQVDIDTSVQYGAGQFTQV